MGNYHSSFYVVDLKLDIEPSLVYCWYSACSAVACGARCAVERTDEYLCTGGLTVGIVELVSKKVPSGSIVPFVLVS